VLRHFNCFISLLSWRRLLHARLASGYLCDGVAQSSLSLLAAITFLKKPLRGQPARSYAGSWYLMIARDGCLASFSAHDNTTQHSATITVSAVIFFLAVSLFGWFAHCNQ
jgi:hypothetical protein